MTTMPARNRVARDRVTDGAALQDLPKAMPIDTEAGTIPHSPR